MKSLRKLQVAVVSGAFLAAAVAQEQATTTAQQTQMDLVKFVQEVAKNVDKTKIIVGDAAPAAEVAAVADLVYAIAYAATENNKQTVKVSYEVTGKKVVLEEQKTVVEGMIPLYTDTARLYLGDSIADVKPLIKVGEGTVKGTENDYDYEVYIAPDENAVIKYEDPRDTTEKDPDVLVDAGSDPLYTVKVKFQPGSYLNLDDARGAEITILGKKFYLDVDEDGNVVLRDAAAKVTLERGQTYDFEGHKIELVDIVKNADNTYSVLLKVDNTTVTIGTGQDETVNGVDIYVENVYVSELEEGKGYAELLIGGKKIVLHDGTAVEINGENDYRVVPVITKDSNGNIQEIDFKIYKSDSSDSNYVKEGTDYVPPVFDTYKFQFEKVDLKSGDEVKVVNSGDNEYLVSLKDYRGYEYQVPVYEYNGQVRLFDNEGNDVVAGTIIGTVDSPTTELKLAKGEYFAVFDSKTKTSYVYEVNDIGVCDNDQSTVQLYDVFAKKTIEMKFSCDSADPTEWTVGSFTFNVYVDGTNKQLVFENVDEDDTNSFVKDAIEHYLVNESYVVAKQDTTNNVVTFELYKKYPSVSTDYKKVADFTIDYDSTNEKIELKDVNVYNTDGSTVTAVGGPGDDYNSFLSDFGVYAIEYVGESPYTVTFYIPPERRYYKVEFVPTGKVKTVTETITLTPGEQVPGTDYKVKDVIADVKVNPTEVETYEAPKPVRGLIVTDTYVVVENGMPKVLGSNAEYFIVVGTPADNAVVAKLCSMKPSVGEAVIKLADEGKVAMVVGGSAADVKNAVEVLADAFYGVQEVVDKMKGAKEVTVANGQIVKSE